MPDKLKPNVYVFELELMEEGVAFDRVAVPPERVNVKSLASNAPLPPDVLYNASLNVTAMLALLDATVVPVIVGAVVSPDEGVFEIVVENPRAVSSLAV